MTEQAMGASTHPLQGRDYPVAVTAHGGHVLADIEAAHRRRWPGRNPQLASRAWLVATSPSLRLLLIHRWLRWLSLVRETGGIRGWMARAGLAILVMPKWLTQVSAKSQLRKDSDIGSGVSFSEDGQIFLGATHIGSGTVIGPRVTVGSSHVDGGCPRIGSNVWIGPDCVLYGAISVGDGATLLPGTVLTKSIPARAVMQGNPARLLRRNFDNAGLRVLGEADALDCADMLERT